MKKLIIGIIAACVLAACGKTVQYAEGEWDITAEEISAATFDSLYTEASTAAMELIDTDDERYPEARALACRALLKDAEILADLVDFDETDSLEAVSELLGRIYWLPDSKKYLISWYEPISTYAFIMDTNGSADSTWMEAEDFAFGKNGIVAGLQGFDCDPYCSIYFYHIEKDGHVRKFAQYEDVNWYFSYYYFEYSDNQKAVVWINDRQLLCRACNFGGFKKNDGHPVETYYLLTLNKK